ncbi:hypothetical protein B5P21_16035 [Clavibacter michiganensis subsp. insidiosus]|nr:hypothetical protein B5P21_16035 [Clavibacter michiganensis subsp. insidiosus]
MDPARRIRSPTRPRPRSRSGALPLGAPARRAPRAHGRRGRPARGDPLALPRRRRTAPQKARAVTRGRGAAGRLTPAPPGLRRCHP